MYLLFSILFAVNLYRELKSLALEGEISPLLSS